MRLNVIKIYYIVSKYKTYKIWVFLVQLGIGGIKININVPSQISKEDAKVADKFTLTTKSEQEIVSMKVSLIERILHELTLYRCIRNNDFFYKNL